MKNYTLLLLLIFLACNPKNETLNANKILANSIQKHDPNNNIKNLNFNIRIQEPRLGNPIRFSNVILNNKTGKFILERNRDSSISKHIIDENGIAKTLLDDKIISESELIKKFRLDPNRNFNYRNYYRIFSLFPMSLKTVKHTVKKNFNEVNFNSKKAYQINIELEELVFSEHWKLYFSTHDFTFLGGEIIYPNKPNEGEKIMFEGNIIIDGVQISRFHHWYNVEGNFLGSDIIIKEIK